MTANGGPLPQSVFVLVSCYLLEPDEVAVLIPRHSAWIAEGYAAGRVLVSGRQEPPVGGVIVAIGTDADDVRDWIAGDPFVLGGAAEYVITEFRATDFPKRSTAFDTFAAAFTTAVGA